MKQRLYTTLLAGMLCLGGTKAWAEAYQIGSADDLKAFAAQVATNPDAVLTADIDMKDQGWTSLEDYAGTFDGQGFTIKNLGVALFNTNADGAVIKNLTIASDEGMTLTYSNFSPFVSTCRGNLSFENCVNQTAIARSNARRLGGFIGRATCTGKTITITNCRNEAEFFIRSAETAGFIGHDYGNTVTIKNSLNLAKIWSDEDYAMAGFIGESAASGTYTFENCGNTGMIICRDDFPGESCAFIGRARGEITLINCWNSGQTLEWTYSNESDAPNYGTGKVVNNPLTQNGLGTYINCYDVYNGNFGVKQIAEEFVANGALCYLLNGDQTALTFFQTLGEDTYPVLDATHSRVYKVGAFKCDGMTPKDETGGYSNTAGTSTIDEHAFEDGICSVCHTLDMSYVDTVDGVYQIGTAGQLRWFSYAINQWFIPNTSGAVLTADIDLEYASFTPIGLYADENSEQKKQIGYAGTFDGQGHTISNLAINEEFFHEAGLVSRLYGTVQNLGIINAAVTTNNGYNRAATIAGWKSSGNILNCFAIGDLSLTTEAPGGIFAGGNGSIKNCYTTFENICHENGGSMNNCFSQENMPDIAEKIRTGELCYKLNGESFLSSIWYQNVGLDEYPVLDPTHGIVYQMGEGEFKSATADNFETFRNDIIERETQFCQEVIAYQGAIDDYQTEIDTWEAIESIPEFLTAYSAGLSKKTVVQNSEKVYKTYIDACDKVAALLAETTAQNEQREILENYLDKENATEPSSLYPNGNQAYILTNHLLTNEQIPAEIKFLELLQNRFLIADPDPDTDMTVLLQNPQFTDGWNGWETTGKPIQNGTSSDAFTVQQTLTGMPNGIYLFQVGALARVDGDPNLENHTGEIFINGNHNFIMTPLEGMISQDEAVDSVNCHLSNPTPDDYVEISEGEYGYVPAGIEGLNIAINAGRYQNFVAAQVTDGTLTVGIRKRDYNFSVWQPFAGIRLIYLGTADEAGEKLAAALQSSASRAQTILDINQKNEYTADYDRNVSQEIRTQLQAAIDKSQTELDAQSQLALIGTFSDLFDQIYDCRKAYLTLGKAILNFQASITKLFETGIITEENFDEMTARASGEWEAHATGGHTTSGALARAEELKTALGIINQDEDGNYLIATHMDLILFSLGISSNDEFPQNANAKLTADIDMSSVQNFPPIGVQGAEFKGNFDGQGHTIKKLTVNSSTDYAGLFGVVGGGAVIQNLVVDAESSISTTGRFAGLVGGTDAGGFVTLKNVGNEANVTCAGANAAGIIGVNVDNRATITLVNCYMTGKVQGGSDSALLTGWGGPNMTATNCWCIGEVTGGLNGDYVYRVNSGLIATNVFSLNGDQLGAGATKITEEDVTGGALTYSLNDHSTEGAWTQQLGTDPHPVLFGTAKVYACGSFQCDGVTPAEGTSVEYSNTEGTHTVAPHTLNEDHICSVCGNFDPELIIDGVYQIASAAQLKAFRNLPKMNSLSARLTADIDMKDQGWSGPTGYSGSFDGDGHTITNLGNTALFTTTASGAVIKNLTLTGGTRTLSKDSGTGVFVDVAKGNLFIENCVNETPITGNGWNWHAGGIVGQIDVAEVNVEIFGCTNKADIIITNEAGNYGHQIGGLVGFLTAPRAKLTMTNCLNTGEVYSIGGASIGGIVAQTNNGYVTLHNCGNTGKVTCRAGLNEAGPMLGHAASGIGDLPVYITNCWNIGETVGNNAFRSLAALLEANTRAVYTNCYDIQRVYEGEAEGVTVITPEDAPSGALTYMLNEGADETIFYQHLGEDLYPVFDPAHMVVLKAADGTYYNVADGIEEVKTENRQERTTNAIYDLSGRRVEKPTRGIYIINGKKVFVK